MAQHEFEAAMNENPLLAHLWRHGRLLRAARELAQEEFALGSWVDEAEAPQERMRFAARDHDEVASVTLSDADFAVRVYMEGNAVFAVQESGKTGATLELDNGWVPLEPNKAALLPGVTGLPKSLLLLGTTGRRHKLD
jgi:hypothetical protein